jgi:type VI secretion system protein VasD
MIRMIPLAVVAGLLLLQSGCTAVNSGVGGYFGLDTDLKISFVADADINPDDNKKPSPLYIRLYELKSTKMFNKADFISLYERDKEIIGADFVAVQKLKPLKPGDKRDDFLVLDSSTTYVALYAEFLQYKDAVYRVVIPVTSNNIVTSSATVRISGNALKILDGSNSDAKSDERSSNEPKSRTKTDATSIKATTEKPPAKKPVVPVNKGDDNF